MGVKGEKPTKGSVLKAELIAGKLAAIDGITAKRMFGGHGLSHEGKMSALVDSEGWG